MTRSTAMPGSDNLPPRPGLLRLPNKIPSKILKFRPALGLLALACAALPPRAWAAGNPPQGSPPSDAVCPAELPGTLGLDPLDPVDTSEVGWTPGEFAVTSSGEATYTIPLAVPPGRAGMAPTLAITYSSDGGDGLLGRGFSLTGLSRVTRCPKNTDVDGEAHAVAYDDTDVYCLDGKRLVLVEDMGASKEYRTIPDTHVRVRAVRTGEVPGPTYFQVEESSGIQKWYGTASDSRPVAANGYVASWALSEIQDRTGNSIHYEYHKGQTTWDDPFDGSDQPAPFTEEHYLQAIHYTGPSPQRSVELTYEPVFAHHAFAGQMDLLRAKRLKAISMFGPDHKKVRDYELTYQGFSASTSRLIQVTECVDVEIGGTAHRRCLAPTHFEWTEAPEDGFERIPTGVSLLGNDPWVLADVNGDGLDDVVISWGLVNKHHIYVGLGTGEVSRPFQELAPWVKFEGSDGAIGAYEILPADLDNDGRTDLVLQAEPDHSSHVRWLHSVPGSGPNDPAHFELLTTNIPRQSSTDEVNEALDGENSLKLGDFDGDGAVDVLRCRREYTFVGTTSEEVTDYFNAQVGANLYHTSEEMVYYRNLGNGDFASGIAAYDSICDSSPRQVVAPIHGDGKNVVLSDEYGIGYKPVYTSVGVFHSMFTWSTGTYRAQRLTNSGEPFESVETNLAVHLDNLAEAVDSVGWHDANPLDQSRRPLVADVNGDGVLDSVVLARDLRECEEGEAGRHSQEFDDACWDTNIVVTFGQAPLTEYLSVPFGGGIAGVSAQMALPAPRSIVKPLIDQAIAFHYDDDDMADILFPLQGSCAAPLMTCYVVLRSTGYLWSPFEIIPTNIPYYWETTPGDYIQPETTPVQFADIDANGRPDLVIVEPSSELVVHRRAAAPARVTRIIEGRNPRSTKDPKFVPSVEIEYGPLVDRRQTKADLVAFGDENVGNTQPGPKPEDLYQARWRSQSCAWPVACVAGSRQVVSRYHVHDGLEGRRSVAMMYRDARYDVAGHRWLGFGAVMRVDLDTLAGSATFMDNEQYDTNLKVYPFAGVPGTTWEWKPALPNQPNNQQLLLTFEGTLHAIVPTVGGSYFRYPALRRTWTDEAQFNPDHGIYQLLAKVEQESASPTNVLTDRRHLVMDVDSFGNVLSEQSETVGVPGMDVTTHAYANNVTDWILGRETYRETCSTAGPDTQCRRRWQWYDDNGALEHAQVGDPAAPSTVLHSWYTRDGRGNVIGTVQMDGLGEKRSTCSTYDAEGVFVVGTNNSEDLKARFEYDRGLGVKLAEKDANGFVTRWAVDAFGRARRQIHHDKTEVWTSVTREPGCGDDGLALCTVTTTQTSSGSWQRTFADSLGRTVRTLVAGPDVEMCSHKGVCQAGATIAVDEEYDRRGLRIKLSRPYMLGDSITPRQYEEVQYDAAGREVLRQQPGGLMIETTYEGLTTTRFDGWGETVTVHDAKGRVVSVKDALTTETTYSFGPFGVTTTVQVGGQTAETTTAIHDAYGREIEHHDPDQGTTITTYNGYGEPRTVSDALGRTVVLTRDGIGRVTHRQDADGTSIYEYDTAANGKGRRASEKLVVQGVTLNQKQYAYDENGRVNHVALERGSEVLETEVSYNLDGLPWELTYPDDGSGVRFKVRHFYDSRGNLNAVKGMRFGDGVATLPGYEPLWKLEGVHTSGQARLETFGNGAGTRTQTNPATGAITAIETSTPGQPQSVQALSYDYDTRGNLSRRGDALQGGGIPGVANGVSEWFEHDLLGRLTCTRVAQGDMEPQGPCTLALDYEPNGNIEHKSDIGTYHYADPAHPHAVTLTTGGPQASQEYQYDAVGNQTRRGVVSVSYTARNKARAYTLGPGNLVSFEYTAAGDRLRKLSSQTDTLWFGNMYQRRTDLQTGAVEHRFHVFGRDRVVADIVHRLEGSGQWMKKDPAEYQHVDHLGSLDVVTDDDGAVTERVSFDAFGRRRDPDWLITAATTFGPLPSLGFTGQEEDHEIGVIDLNARLYDPALGRFLNVDPHVTNPLSAQSWNGYSYVRNRPTVFIDPTGMDDASLFGLGSLPSTGIPVVDEMIADAANGVGAVIDYVANGGQVPVAKVAAGEELGPDVVYWDALSDRSVQMSMAGYFIQEGMADAARDMAFGTIRTVLQMGSPTAAALTGMGSIYDVPPAPDVTGNYWADQVINVVPITRMASGFVRTGIALGSGDPYGAGYTFTAPAIEAGLLAASIYAAGCFVAGTPVVTEEGLRPVETLQVGERVRTIGDSVCASPIDASRLRRIEVRMPNPDRPGDVVQITTLRPIEWIVQQGVHEGNHVYLDLGEIGYRGYGHVDSISGGVTISSGPGCVVLSTFSHVNSDVRALRFVGAEQTVHGTSRHPFYSVDRRDWVPAGKLMPGERLRAHTGETVVDMIAPLTGHHRVYNLEVHSAHTYLIGHQALWVHNSCFEPTATASDYTSMFRAVSPGEYADVMSYGGFRPAPGGLSLAGKQFGLNLTETMNFANKYPDIAAVLRVDVPRASFVQFEFSRSIDPFIFKSGVVTVQPGAQLELLNGTLLSIEHVF